MAPGTDNNRKFPLMIRLSNDASTKKGKILINFGHVRLQWRPRVINALLDFVGTTNIPLMTSTTATTTTTPAAVAVPSSGIRDIKIWDIDEWEEVDGEIGNVQIAWFGQGGERCDGGRDHERLFDLFIGTSSIHGMGFGMERQMNTPFYTGQLMV
jgi:hypothetical protein